MAHDSSPTLRLRTSSLRVVLVHHDPRVCLPLIEALGQSFVVRLALSTDEMVEHLPPKDRLTCVVGVLDATIRARDIHAKFTAAGGKPERLVFVTKQDLASPTVLEETIAVVRRLGDRRFQ